MTDIHYTYAMGFVLKELKNVISIGEIANLHFFEFERNFFTENDRHPFCELVFVSSGELYVSSEEYSGRLRKNEMIVHRAGARHSLSCTAANAPTIIIIGFACSAEHILDFSRAPILLREGRVRQLAEIVKEGRNVFAPPYDIPTYDMKKKKRQPFGAEQRLRMLLESFFIDLIRESSLGQETGEGAPVPRTSAIREVVQYVDDNFLERITLDELAFLFGTNRATLCKEFKGATGKTVVNYISDKKLVLAKARIAKTDFTFTEISEELGFASVHYFTRFFKTQTGMTPKKYRETYRQK